MFLNVFLFLGKTSFFIFAVFRRTRQYLLTQYVCYCMNAGKCQCHRCYWMISVIQNTVTALGDNFSNIQVFAFSHTGSSTSTD